MGLLATGDWVRGRRQALSFAALFVFSVVLYFRPYELVPALASFTSLAFYTGVVTLAIYAITQLRLEGDLTARPREVNLILLFTLAAVLSMPIARDRKTRVLFRKGLRGLPFNGRSGSSWWWFFRKLELVNASQSNIIRDKVTNIPLARDPPHSIKGYHVFSETMDVACASAKGPIRSQGLRRYFYSKAGIEKLRRDAGFRRQGDRQGWEALLRRRTRLILPSTDYADFLFGICASV
ncbi:MAG TPA: hypothetical protein VMM84_17330 [Pyrinomonadaceae bacterium]|nr:hypothetical protein [Pyrinomonadaceae bacterium]